MHDARMVVISSHCRGLSRKQTQHDTKIVNTVLRDRQLFRHCDDKPHGGAVLEKTILSCPEAYVSQRRACHRKHMCRTCWIHGTKKSTGHTTKKTIGRICGRHSCHQSSLFVAHAGYQRSKKAKQQARKKSKTKTKIWHQVRSKKCTLNAWGVEKSGFGIKRYQKCTLNARGVKNTFCGFQNSYPHAGPEAKFFWHRKMSRPEWKKRPDF